MKFGWYIALFALVGAVGLQLLRVRNIQYGDTASAQQRVDLSHKIPRSPDGWASTDEPLGPTEFQQSAVEKTLNYDDIVNRVYRKNGRSFGVYVAYWSPGRMPVQKVASHTPDRCWSENGWTCEEMRIENEFTVQDVQMKPARWRLFRPPGNGEKQYVMYWHLVGNDIYDYGDRFNQRPDALKWWRDSLSYALKGSGSQYFVRITSPQPIETLRTEAGFHDVLASLAGLGLRADRGPSLSASAP